MYLQFSYIWTYFNLEHRTWYIRESSRDYGWCN